MYRKRKIKDEFRARNEKKYKNHATERYQSVPSPLLLPCQEVSPGEAVQHPDKP